jgi:hypothetical protein
MKKFTLVLTGILLGGMLISQQLFSRSVNFPDRDIPGIENAEKEIKVFPNPSDGRFQLTLDHNGAKKVTTKVYDITGKLIKNISDDLVTEESSVTANVNLESPKSGIYFLRIEIGSQVITKKIIIR